ncbi:MAG: flagellar hook-associated protein 3 [Candidatus Schekmanbacteria bacterium]|nr:MAG: flagellar hook-associated protein 3 [Candidatus Schekmanbacteria bacterium]
MRVTYKMILSSLLDNISNISERINNLEKQAASGKRINKPSDDPYAYNKSLSFKSLKKSMSQFEKNLSSGKEWLSTTDTALQSANDLLIRAKEIALSASNDTMSADERETAAIEVQGLFEQMVQIANTKLGSKYIFAGTAVSTEAFDSNGNYNGNSSNINIEIDANKRMTINFTGDNIFKGASGGEDVFDVLSDLKTALENNDTDNIASQISRIDTSMNQVLDYRANTGAKINQIENTETWYEDSKARLDILLSENEDADIIEVLTQLAKEQSAYKATLATTSEIMSNTLAEFLK